MRGRTFCRKLKDMLEDVWRDEKADFGGWDTLNKDGSLWLDIIYDIKKENQK